MKDLGIGVVGCGFVGRGAHVPSFANIEGARLVAVADADEKRRNKAATKHKVESAYDDYQKLMNDPQVDAVMWPCPRRCTSRRRWRRWKRASTSSARCRWPRAWKRPTG